MTSSKYLFELIKTLSKSEKRYFKLFSSKHVIGDNNNYLKLFNVIERQKIYNEEEVKKVLKNDSFTKHFAFAKNYLHRLVLDALHAYHLNLSSESILKKKLHQVSVLFDKGLYSHCEKLLKKIKSEAQKIENHIVTLETMKWQKKIIPLYGYKKISDKQLDIFLNEEKLLLQYIANISAYENIEQKLMLLSRKSAFDNRKKAHSIIHADIMRNPLLKKESYAINNTSKGLYNTIHAVYNCDIKGDFIHGYKFDKRKVELVELNPLQIQASPRIYMSALRNLLISSIRLKKYDEAFFTIKKMRSINDRFKLRLHPGSIANIFVFSYVQELAIHINLGDFHKINSVIKNIESGLGIYKNKIDKSSEKELFYTLAYIYFGNHDYKKSLEWLNRIINSPDQDVRRDLIRYSKIMGLLVHYELKHFDLLPYSIKSTSRFLKKQDTIYPEETIIINSLKKLTQIKSKGELTAIYLEVKKNILSVTQEPFQSRIDIITWLDSKIENRSFAEIIKEKLSVRH